MSLIGGICYINSKEYSIQINPKMLHIISSKSIYYEKDRFY